MAICAGCGRDSKEFPCYDGDEPVTEDGTYKDGKFVCDYCYLKLCTIDRALSVGKPNVLQANAKIHCGAKL